MLSNKEIAEMFFEIADILEIQGVEFKPQAYRKAARQIESLGESIYEVYKKGGLKSIQEIPGVGKNISLKIEEILKTGKLRYFEKLKKTLPPKLFNLMRIPAVGPKKIAKLYKELKIKNISELKKAIKQHKVAELKGFGEKTEQEILEGLKILKKGKERMLLGDAYPIAYSIKQQLTKLPYVIKIDIVGSLRRMKETIGDIDILCITKENQKAMDFFTSMQNVKKVLMKGSTKSSILLKDGIHVDLRVLPERQYGSALQYFTGSKEHSVHLRQIAMKKGFKLSEYGLFRKKGNKLIVSKTEEEIYKKLGMQIILPELRENNGEIEAALGGKLPKLIGYDDIKGDLQMHSKYSDGGYTIKEMADYCKNKLKYEYIAITDHSQSQKIAGGLTVKELMKQAKEIEKLNKSYNKFRIFKSIESDIKADGSLDYKNDVLKKLDLVAASIHSGFKKENTQRMLKAMDNRYVKVICHPTGRLINERNPYQINIEKIFEKAHDNDIWIEVNADPHRLDIKDVYIKKAVEMKVKLVISTDAHSISNLDNMFYGIAQAIRGWAGKRDVVNGLGLRRFEKLL